MKKAKFTREYQNLIRRYLLWAYKSTKEEFERIERKTTQLIVDDFILGHFAKNKYKVPGFFVAYVADKRKEELKLKFADGQRKKGHPRYVYLKRRLQAIEAAIRHFLGAKEFKSIQRSYEGEFTRRIWEAREGH